MSTVLITMLETYSFLFLLYNNYYDLKCHQLSRKVVQNIHLSGGSLLGVSRGGPTVTEIVDSIQVYNEASFLFLDSSSFISF